MGMFNALNQGGYNNNQNNMNDWENQFKQFKARFTGDPNAIIQQNLQAGIFTPAMVERAQAIASRLPNLSNLSNFIK